MPLGRVARFQSEVERAEKWSVEWLAEWLAIFLRGLLLKKQFDDSPVLTYFLLWQVFAIVLVVCVAGWHVLWPF